MAFPFILLATQAAGIGMNLYAQSRAEKFTQMGEELDKMQLRQRMGEEQLASSQKSLYNLERLREVMATQRAIMGARGQMPGVGSAGALTQKSIGSFNKDEEARRLSQTFKQNQFESQMRLYGLNRANRQSKRGSKIMQQGLNMFSFNAFGENPFKGFGGGFGG